MKNVCLCLLGNGFNSSSHELRLIGAVWDRSRTTLRLNLKAQPCDDLSLLRMPESWLCTSRIELPSAVLSGSCGGSDNQTHTDKHTAVWLTPLQDVCHTSI